MKVNTGYLAFATLYCRFPLLRCVVRSFCLSFGPDQIGIICLAASRIGREKGSRPHQTLRRESACSASLASSAPLASPSASMSFAVTAI